MKTREEAKREIELEIKRLQTELFNNSKLVSDAIEKIEFLQKELEELNKLESINPKRWKPDFMKIYYYYDSAGEIFSATNTSDKNDLFRYKTRNCFKTKQEAEEELERILFVNEVRDFIEEENGEWEPDFYNEKQIKYYLFVSYFLVKSSEIGEKILAKFDNDKLIRWWI